MSYILINKSNYFHNLNIISKQINSKDKLFVVLKDNAYGHGIRQMAKLSKEFGIKQSAVQTIKEAIIIKNYFPYILVFNDFPKDKMEGIGFAINYIKYIGRIPKNSIVELKIDTGMHRNGIKMEEISDALRLIKNKNLILKGVFTHFKSADELTSEYFWQKENFKEVKKEVKRVCNNLKIPLPFFHSHNSAAIFRNKNFNEDFARSGISIYGYHCLPYPLPNPSLKPVLSLWAEKISTAKLKKGARIGYGGVFETPQNMTVSTYDIGYGDGFFRNDGLTPIKTANGKNILGRISMNNMSIAGDDKEVCLFNDASYLAKYFHTITYEITTRLSPNIKRIIV